MVNRILRFLSTLTFYYNDSQYLAPSCCYINNIQVHTLNYTELCTIYSNTIRVCVTRRLIFHVILSDIVLMSDVTSNFFINKYRFYELSRDFKINVILLNMSLDLMYLHSVVPKRTQQYVQTKTTADRPKFIRIYATFCPEQLYFHVEWRLD